MLAQYNTTILRCNSALQSCPAFLQANFGIVSLSLRSNCLKDEGADALADAMRKNWTVTRMNLSVNAITRVGAADQDFCSLTCVLVPIW